MLVQVDESWRHHHSGRFKSALSLQRGFAHSNHAARDDPYVPHSVEARFGIDDPPVADNKVVAALGSQACGPDHQ